MARVRSLLLANLPAESRAGTRDTSAETKTKTKAGRPIRILELGCGAAQGLSHLTDAFAVTGVDASAAMIDLARRQCRSAAHPATFYVGDMRSIRLDDTFDAVLAVDALDYMTTEADLLAALTTAAGHLKKGGLLLAATNYLADDFEPHESACDHHVVSNLEVTHIAHVSYAASGTATGEASANGLDVNGNGSANDHTADNHSSSQIELTLLLLIRERGRLRIEEDRHTCGLFTEATWLQLLDTAGFDAAYVIDESDESDDDARLDDDEYEPDPAPGVFIATRR